MQWTPQPSQRRNVRASQSSEDSLIDEEEDVDGLEDFGGLKLPLGGEAILERG